MFNNNKNNNKNGKSGTTTMNRKSNNNQNISSVNIISEETEVKGTLITKNDIRIAGKIEGEAQVDGKIIVASTGHIDGNIEANDADVAGRVEAEIHTSGILTLRESAVIEGDLHTQSLVVEEGATFNGSCHMHDFAETKKSKKDKKTPSLTAIEENGAKNDVKAG